MGSLQLMRVLGVGLFCGFAFAFAQEPSANSKPAPYESADLNPVMMVQNYALSDLPVWTKDGKYNPNVLIALFEMSIEPHSWEAQGGPSSVQPYSQNASLVVSTTKANHDKLANLLQQLRR